jgi:hypothetical protein
MPDPHPSPPLPDPSPPVDRHAYHLLSVPVAWTDEQGRVLGTNSAFDATTGLRSDDAIGRPLADLLGLTETDPLLAHRLQAGEPLVAQPLQWRSSVGHGGPARLDQQVRPGLRVVTLVGSDFAAAAPTTEPWPSAAERLDWVQTLGGFGSWTHDLRSGERQWDAHVWRFLGLSPRAGALPLPEALALAHPDDRDAVSTGYRQSLGTPGRHSVRWRLLRPDGGLRHVRSLWQVLAGADGRAERVIGMQVDDTEPFALARSADDALIQLNLAVALADIAVWQHDFDSGLVHTSERGWALMGLPPQPQGMTVERLAQQVHPDDRATLRAQVAAAFQVRAQPGGDDDSAPIDLGLRCRQADGRWRYLLTRRVRRRDDQGRLIGHLGVVLDLSERFDQQQQALALAQRLEMATAAAGVGVWSLQLGDPPVPHWDEQMRALHGLPRDHPPPTLERYLAEQVHPADRATVTDSLTLLMQRDEGLLELDLRIVCPDGSERRLATRTSITGAGDERLLHGVMLDVTERYATEQRLRQATERAVLAARGAGLGTWESDAPAATGWWDEQMFKLRGMDRGAGHVQTAEMLHWMHPDDRDNYTRRLTAALQQDGPANYEFRVVWPDGTVRWLASRSVPVRDESGKTGRRIGINWDITDARNAEAARQERLLAQRESQAKSRLLARISHELRTPMNAVLGFTQLLLHETPPGVAPDPQTWRSRIEQVKASGEHLMTLIDDVLELSSLQSGELPLSLQPVALAPLARDCLPLVELLAREHGVQLRLGALDGWVLADPARLRQVLLNLLSNAIKYNHPGGQVTVSTESSDRWLLLRVADTGRGLSEAQLSHLFEPFNRLGAEREGIAGTGIGLAIVQASMQQMGGSVQVRSTPGVGSVFELSLQASAATQPHASGFQQGVALPPLPLPRGGKLLYIEDNEVNLLIVSELLRRRPDLGLMSAGDGASGLAMARERQPALILLDMQLPDMDGHEVLRRLRADPATAGIRCIALSANAMPEDIQRARAAGVEDYWTKPLDLGAFMRAIDALFGPAPPV